MDPLTYLSNYIWDSNTLLGSYNALLAPYVATSSFDPDTLINLLLAQNDMVPKVFIRLINKGNGVLKTCTFGYVVTYLPHLVGTTVWDRLTFAF
jgi:hypothetical protein